jgi:hypothetical protein
VSRFMVSPTLTPPKEDDVQPTPQETQPEPPEPSTIAGESERK